MDNYQEYNISVGRFAKLCNTTKDTLRHYYENGILIPYKDEKNGYHYYSSSQVSSYYIINIFRQSGYSVNEIKELILCGDKAKLLKTAGDKLQDLHNELISVKNKISSLTLGLWVLETHAKIGTGIPYICDIPFKSIIKTELKTQRAHHANDIAKDLFNHITSFSPDHKFSLFPTGVSIAREDFLNDRYNYNAIISLSLDDPDNNIHTAPPGNKLLCCFGDHHKPIEESYLALKEYIEKNNIKKSSDLYIISLINLYDTTMKHTYLKFMFLII